MNTDYKVTLCYITARRDHPMIGRPGVHQFDVFLDSVAKQTFPHDEMEVVIVDALKERGFDTVMGKADKRVYDFSRYDFNIKHVSPKSQFWYDNDFTSISNNFNTAFIHADGELLKLFGDCSELMQETNVEQCWEFYKKHNGKKFLKSLFEYYEGGVPQYWNGIRRQEDNFKFFRDNPYFNDYKRCNAAGFCSFSLDLIFMLNGYDEIWDGAKCLEDSDFAIRMERLKDYEMYCHPNNSAVEHFHEPVIYHAKGQDMRNNGPLMELLIKKEDRIRANETVLTRDEVEYIAQWCKDHNPNFNRIPEFDRPHTHPILFELKELWKVRRDQDNC